MATLTADQYKKRWDYYARKIFSISNPVPKNLTEKQIDSYVTQLKAIENDLKNSKTIPLTDALLNTKVQELRKRFNTPRKVIIDPYPTPDPDLNTIYPTANFPTPEQIKYARGKSLEKDDKDKKPKGRPIIAAPTRSEGPFELINNIELADNPPTIYDAIRESDIRRINAETKDPSFDPEQIFKVTITPPGGAGIETQLTPIQYAALKGLKGVVRLLLRSKVDINKKIVVNPDEKLTIIEAIDRFRKKDTDKSDVKFVFTIADTASKDASDDYSSGVKLDSEYGKGLEKEVDKALAKLIYEREYKELENPTLPKVPKKTTTGLVEEARKRGKEDAEKGLERSSEYEEKSELEKKAYQDEYTKYIVEKDKKKGKADGETGSSPDPAYDTKTPEEKEAYGKEYDKARAAYQGERDASMNEPSDYPKLEKELSEYYKKSAPEFYKSSIKKIYNDTYEKNRSKTADLVKEAGYVGTYPPSDAVLSGNYFGFGSELSRIVGFDTSGVSGTSDVDSKYQEGFAEFVKNVQSLIGLAKYAGYTDGMKGNAKYTTIGKNSVNGKDYAVDFGKLNVNVSQQIVDADGKITSNPNFYQSREILAALKKKRDAGKVDEMVKFLKDTLTRPIGDDKDYSIQKETVKEVRSAFGTEEDAARKAEEALVSSPKKNIQKEIVLSIRSVDNIFRQLGGGQKGGEETLEEVKKRIVYDIGFIEHKNPSEYTKLVKIINDQETGEQLTKVAGKVYHELFKAYQSDDKDLTITTDKDANELYKFLKDYIDNLDTTFIKGGLLIGQVEVSDYLARLINFKKDKDGKPVTPENRLQLKINRINKFKNYVDAAESILKYHEEAKKLDSAPGAPAAAASSSSAAPGDAASSSSDGDAAPGDSGEAERLAKEAAAKDAAKKADDNKKRRNAWNEAAKEAAEKAAAEKAAAEKAEVERLAAEAAAKEAAEKAAAAKEAAEKAEAERVAKEAAAAEDAAEKAAAEKAAKEAEEAAKARIAAEEEAAKKAEEERRFSEEFERFRKIYEKAEADRLAAEAAAKEKAEADAKAEAAAKAKEEADAAAKAAAEKEAKSRPSWMKLAVEASEKSAKAAEEAYLAAKNTADTAKKTADSLKSELDNLEKEFEITERSLKAVIATRDVAIKTKAAIKTPDTIAARKEAKEAVSNAKTRRNEMKIEIDELKSRYDSAKKLEDVSAKEATAANVIFENAKKALEDIKEVAKEDIGEPPGPAVPDVPPPPPGPAVPDVPPPPPGPAVPDVPPPPPGPAVPDVPPPPPGPAVPELPGPVVPDVPPPPPGPVVPEPPKEETKKEISYTSDQLYEKVAKALLSFPEFKMVKVAKIPFGLKPDDSSLKFDVNAARRVQLSYDMEFERGYRKSIKKVGGTRRKSKKTNRTTRKKQVSKK